MAKRGLTTRTERKDIQEMLDQARRLWEFDPEAGRIDGHLSHGRASGRGAHGHGAVQSSFKPPAPI